MGKLSKVFQHTKVKIIILILVALMIEKSHQSGAMAQHNTENVTRLIKVAPPATSSMYDLYNLMLRTSSPVSPGPINNCSMINANATAGLVGLGGSDMINSKIFMSDISNFRDGAGVPETKDGSPFRCHSCHVHEKLIELNINSIKQHILNKLQFSSPPNMTNKHAIPQVPKQVVDEFLKKHHLKPTNINRKTVRAGKHQDQFSDSGDDSYSNDETDRESFYSDSEEMQGDAPDVDLNEDDDIDFQREIIEEEEDNYYQTIERLYVFPKPSKHIRHKHNRNDVLHFNFKKDEFLKVSKATLYIFIHSETWLKQHDSENKYEKKFNLTVHQIRRNTKIYHQLVNYREAYVPEHKGHYITIDVSKLVDNWYQDPQSNYGLLLKVNGHSGHKLAVTDIGDKDHTPYIEMFLEDARKRRTRRSATLNCKKDDRETRCCRYPLMVDFLKFEWDWIIAPTSYQANYCAGECSITFQPTYVHTHVWQLSTSATPCCSPTKLSPLTLLYYDNNYNVVQSKIPHMIVEKCSCS